MPGSMIHLLLARKIKPEAGILFYIGNLAPDAATDGEVKDATHFRDIPDRSAALAALAAKTPPSDDFADGVLLHLFLDWRWDILARKNVKVTGDGWFSKYREELSLAGSYAFHHTDWAEDIWEAMSLCDVSLYGEIPGAGSEELSEFIIRNKTWHLNNKTGQSEAFTQEFIDIFIDETADEYNNWRNMNSFAEED